MRARDRVQGGSSLADALAAERAVTVAAARLAKAGEEAGTVPAKLAHGPGIHCQTVHPMPPADQAAMFAEARELGADALVVPYHSCYRQHIKMQLEYGIETEHYFGLLAQALGIAYEEPFKRYRLTDNVNTVMRMLRPRIEQHGYDADLVRVYVERAVFC